MQDVRKLAAEYNEAKRAYYEYSDLYHSTFRNSFANEMIRYKNIAYELKDLLIDEIAKVGKIDKTDAEFLIRDFAEELETANSIEELTANSIEELTALWDL